MKIILAIDDQKDNLITIKAVLKNYLPNCEVITALSGKEGIQIAREKQPDTILLDIIMPGMDGFEVCERLKADVTTKHIPVVMLTAINTDTGSRVKGLDLGADAFLSKPIDPIELSAQVKVMLRIKGAEDKLRAEKTVLAEIVEARTKEVKYQSTVLGNVSDPVISFDMNYNIRSWNHAAEKLYGWKETEAIGKPYNDILRMEFPKDSKEEIGQKLFDTGNYKGQIIQRKKNGEQIIISASLSFIDDTNGNHIGIVSVNHDITLRKKAENALRENEEKLRLVIDNSPVGVTTTDLQGHFLDVNASMCALTGYSRKEMIGSHFNLFSHPDDAVKNEKLFKQLVENKIDFFDLEKRYIHKNENIVHVLVRAQLIRDTKGNPLFQTAIIEDITQRKLSVNLLKKQEARIRSIFRSAPVGIGVVSNRVLIQVNTRLCEMSGYSAAELLNQKSILFYPSQAEYEKVGVVKYDQIKKGGTGTVETKWKRKDGKIIDILLSSTPINPDDWSEGVTFTALDITERKQSEQKIAESEQKFRLLADNTHDWEYWINPEGGYNYLSQSCERIAGYSPDEFYKNPELLFKLVRPDYLKLVRERYSKTKTEDFTTSFEFPLISRSGDERWIEHNCNKVFDEQGAFLGFRGNNRDITERKRSEINIRKLSTAVEQSPSIIVITDTKGIIEYANPKFSELTGYSNTELVGQNPRILKSGKQSAAFYQEFWETISAGKEWHGEFHNKKKNGEYFWESASISPIFDSQGKITSYIKVAEDITERKQIQEALQESQQQLKLIIDKIPGLLAFVDTNEKYLYVNIAYADFYGIRRKKFIGKSLKEVLPAFTYNTAKENFKQVLSGKESINENVIPREDGSKSFILAKNIPHFDEQGKVNAFLITIEDITERKRSEQVQKVLYNISQAAFLSTGIEDLITIIQKELGKILDTTNFYIAFYDEKTDTFSSPFVSDEKDDLTTWPAGKSFSSYVVNTCKPLLATKEVADKMRAAGELINVGVTSAVWLGAPLIFDGVAKGVFAVQSYTNENAYTKQDLDMLEFVATQLSTLLEKKNAEKILKESEERYKTLSTLTYEGIVLHDNGVVVDLNLSFAKMFGYDYEEIVNENIIRFLDPEYFITEKKSKKDISFPYEAEGIKKDGTHFPIEIEGREVFIASENKILRVAAVRDITVRKKTEQIQKVLYNISNAVIITENLEKLVGQIQIELGKIIDVTNFHVAFYDEKTDTITIPFFSNKKVGIPEIATGKTLSRYLINQQKSLLINKEKLIELRESNEIRAFEVDPEIWLGVPLKNKGKLTGILVVQSYTDKNAYNESDLRILEFVSDQVSISIHRKKAELDLLLALQKATESDRLKSAFLATMSHELRTPLNAIIGFSEFLNKDLPVDDVVSFGQIINSSGEHLLSIINDLFDITLIEAGETKVKHEEIALKSVFYDVQSVIEAKKKRDDKPDVSLELNFSAEKENFSFKTDANKIKQILINLLKNALKFTHEGSITYGCSLISEDKQQFLRFYVKDTGIGIEADKKEIIFEIFRQADDTHTRSYGGTGIGLSVARRLTEALGGKIWLETEVGIGSTFYFTIPVANLENNSQTTVTLIETPDENKPNSILVAEDDLMSYKFIEVVLRKLEIDIAWVKNGHEAILYCKENPGIDLVLMDINMPVLNGYLATKEIKKFLPDLPIIAQTAFAIAGDREKSLEAGCDDYITKPINKDELVQLIKKYI